MSFLAVSLLFSVISVWGILSGLNELFSDLTEALIYTINKQRKNTGFRIIGYLILFLFVLSAIIWDSIKLILMGQTEYEQDQSLHMTYIIYNLLF
jgi:hypothetical protein